MLLLSPIIFLIKLYHLSSTDTLARYAAYFRNIGRLIRYFAFTSDVGEAVRPIAHKRVVQGCYGVSWLYVIGDVSYEGWKEK